MSDFTANLSGKVFLNVREAAYCACVSVSQFNRLAPDMGIGSCFFMGKKVYRQQDILDRMNDAWHEAHSGEAAKEAAAVAAEAGSKIGMERFIKKARGPNWRSRK